MGFGGGGADERKGLRKWTEQHPVPDSWETCSARNWEDRVSTSSFSEADDATIIAPFRSDHSVDDGGSGGIYETVRSELRRAVSEIRDDLENVILKKNSATITAENIVNTPPGSIRASMFEFVSEIKREYATKLELSQERARKLRADLAVEEQRGQELSKILEEMVSDSKSTETRKPRPKRKASIERLKMSRLLAEEAMNYFDECVSISTFESSEFSSIDDPHLGLANGISSMGNSRFYPTEASASRTVTAHGNHYEESDYQTPRTRSIAGSEFTVDSTCNRSKAASLTPANGSSDDLVGFVTPRSGSNEFSFSRGAMETGEVNNIRHYIKKFGKEFRKESVVSGNVRSSYNADDYDNESSAEKLLFDRVLLRGRIESGGLLLCDIRIF